MQTRIVVQGEVDAIWSQVSIHLQKGIDHIPNDLSLGWLWQQCRAGNLFLMIAFDDDGVQMASIWRFEDWPTGTVLRCLVLGGGKLSKWANEAKNLAYSMARDGGAQSISVTGRLGWSRIFKDAQLVAQVYDVKVG